MSPLTDEPFDKDRIKIIDSWVDAQVQGGGMAATRPTYLIRIDNNPNMDILFYMSTGTGGGKAQGEWQAIAGYITDIYGESWYNKNPQTVKLTQGDNKFLTGISKYLSDLED